MEKLCTDQLVERLAELFDTQIATLMARNVPKQIAKILQKQKGTVLTKANEMVIGDGNIPFLPVIPRSFCSIYNLMSMVRNGGKAGYYTHLNPTAISDVVKTPSEPYYIYDVEDGSSTCGKSPENAPMSLEQQKRSRLTVAEVIALTTHTDVISMHRVWATGSRYKSDDMVLGVFLGDGGRPRLDWGYVGFSDFSSDRWGSPSCGSR